MLVLIVDHEHRYTEQVTQLGQRQSRFEQVQFLNAENYEEALHWLNKHGNDIRVVCCNAVLHLFGRNQRSQEQRFGGLLREIDKLAPRSRVTILHYLPINKHLLRLIGLSQDQFNGIAHVHTLDPMYNQLDWLAELLETTPS